MGPSIDDLNSRSPFVSTSPFFVRTQLYSFYGVKVRVDTVRKGPSFVPVDPVT